MKLELQMPGEKSFTLPDSIILSNKEYHVKTTLIKSPFQVTPSEPVEIEIVDVWGGVTINVGESS